MNKTLIRKAKISDINSITKLLYQVHDVHAKIRPDIFVTGSKKYNYEQLLSIINNENSPIFVYTIDENIYGYCFCIFIENKDDESRTKIKTLYIDDLCVDKDYRNHGIGKQLYDYVKKYAKENNCYSINLNVWEGNENAIKFYKSLGLSTLKYTLEDKI